MLLTYIFNKWKGILTYIFINCGGAGTGFKMKGERLKAEGEKIVGRRGKKKSKDKG
jgi:hypothetical protein